MQLSPIVNFDKVMEIGLTFQLIRKKWYLIIKDWR